MKWIETFFTAGDLSRVVCVQAVHHSLSPIQELHLQCAVESGRFESTDSMYRAGETGLERCDW